MKGTRLWQAPGSPIIQGRSRTSRTFWASWLSGAVTAGLVALIVGLALLLSHESAGPRRLVAATAGLLSVAGGLGLAGCVVGSAVGAGLARSMGWRREWLAGGLLGAVLAALLVLWF